MPDWLRTAVVPLLIVFTMAGFIWWQGMDHSLAVDRAGKVLFLLWAVALAVMAFREAHRSRRAAPGSRDSGDGDPADR